MQFREEFDTQPDQRRRSERLPPPGRQRPRAPRDGVRPRRRQRDARSVLMPVSTVAPRCASRSRSGSPIPSTSFSETTTRRCRGWRRTLPPLVEDELRAFNVERLYASDKVASPAAIAESARPLPMMGDRRVVVVLRAEKILKPKRRGKAEDRASESTSRATRPQTRRARSLRREAGADDRQSCSSPPMSIGRGGSTRRSRRPRPSSSAGASSERKDTKASTAQAARQAEALVKQAATEAGQADRCAPRPGWSPSVPAPTSAAPRRRRES